MYMCVWVLRREIRGKERNFCLVGIEWMDDLWIEEGVIFQLFKIVG